MKIKACGLFVKKALKSSMNDVASCNTQSLYLNKILKRAAASLYSQLSCAEEARDEEEESAHEVRVALSARKNASSPSDLERRKDATSPMSTSCASAKIRASRETHSTHE